MKISPWNILAFGVILLWVALVIVLLAIFIDPVSSLNPFPPATLPASVVIPSATATYRQLPPTWTPTVNGEILLPTFTSAPTSTGFILPTMTNTSTSTPTKTNTPTVTKTPTITPTETLDYIATRAVLTRAAQTLYAGQTQTAEAISTLSCAATQLAGGSCP